MISIGKLDIGGVNKDISKYDLAPMVFTDAIDVDFENGGVVPAVKDVGVFFGMSDNPLYVSFVNGIGGSVHPVYLSATKGHVILSSTHSDITRTEAEGGDYSATLFYKWNGGFFHGYMVWTNGADVPQVWNPFKPEERMRNLPNWPSSIRVALIRPYLNFLIGLGYTNQNGGTDAQTVIWSDITDPGNLPLNWNIGDPTSKAGAYSLTASSEQIMEAQELNGMLYIYKKTTIWTMRYIAGTYVMSFSPSFQNRGALAPRCVLSLAGEHFCLDRLGFYIHNGTSIRDVGKDVVTDYFFKTINNNALYSVFLSHEEAKNRIWIFYPTGTNRYADKALVWDYKKNTWTFRNVQQAICAAPAAMSSYGSTGVWDQYDVGWGEDALKWENDTSSWSTQITWDTIPTSVFWDDLPGRQAQRSLHYASFIDKTTVTFDPVTGFSTDGLVVWRGTSAFPPLWYIPKEGLRKQGYIERLNLSVIEQDATGAFSVDRSVYKHLTELYPEVESVPIEIRWGTQSLAGAPVQWEDWQVFSPDIDIKLDPNITEKFLALSFRGKADLPFKWALTGYSLNIHNAGRY